MRTVVQCRCGSEVSGASAPLLHCWRGLSASPPLGTPRKKDSLCAPLCWQFLPSYFNIEAVLFFFLISSISALTRVFGGCAHLFKSVVKAPQNSVASILGLFRFRVGGAAGTGWACAVCHVYIREVAVSFCPSRLSQGDLINLRQA